MKKKLLKALSTALVLAMVIALTIVGTVAYLNSQSNDVINTFNISEDVEISMDEAKVEKNGDDYVVVGNDRVIENDYNAIYPGAELPKDPTIHVADDSADLYTRAYVTVTGGKNWLDLFGADYVDAFNALTDNTLGENWVIVDAVENGDDVVYEILYTERLVAGQSTTPIFTEIEIPTSFAKTELDQLVEPNGEFQIKAYAEALQASGFRSAVAAFANYEGEFVVADAASLLDAIDDAQKGATIILDAADYGVINIDETLEDVVIVADADADVRFNILAAAVLKDVTIEGLGTYSDANSGSYTDGGIVNIKKGAKVENLVIADAVVAGAGGRSSFLTVEEPTATVTLDECTVKGTKYLVYGYAPIAELSIQGCEISNIGSWVVMMNAGDTVGAKLTIDGCDFYDCNGGIAKYLGAAQTEGAATVFTGNDLTNCVGHDGKDNAWFAIPGATDTITVAGNTLNGADWAPSVAEGLGK